MDFENITGTGTIAAFIPSLDNVYERRERKQIFIIK